MLRHDLHEVGALPDLFDEVVGDGHGVGCARGRGCLRSFNFYGNFYGNGLRIRQVWACPFAALRVGLRAR
jgi:hypothetical protein